MNIILENIPCFDKHEDGEIVIKKSERDNLLSRLLAFIYERIPQSTAIERDENSTN